MKLLWFGTMYTALVICIIGALMTGNRDAVLGWCTCTVLLTTMAREYYYAHHS